MIQFVPYFILAGSVVALAFAYIFYKQMKKQDEGTPTMRQIAQFVREGAMAYLKQQYKVVVIVFFILAALFAILAYGFNLQNHWVPFAFLTGGFFSGLAGYIGMKTATFASGRTAYAASKSLNAGLKLAFRSGAVMGLTVVGLGLLDIALWWIVLNIFVPAGDAITSEDLVVITTTMLTFGMGASTQALFARVGGGIYTKAADVGADIVGKVESDLPEDDPRNPATIADNVGDNVGDVAGMGADLYESYCGSILATAALGAAAFYGNPEIQTKAIFAPMLIAAVGVLLSIIGIFVVRTKEGAGMDQLLKSLSRGTNLSSLLIAASTFGILYLLFPDGQTWWRLGCSVVTGLLAGVIIGKSTEYYTSHSYKPTQKLAQSAKTGPATVIISGIGLGMLSTAIPVVTIAFAIVLSFAFATGFDLSIDNLSTGLYGISIAAVGMLSTLGITLATDAYGPIADNAGGNAQMSELDPVVRERTDVLDALGNTTAATGKGFAIGSAALTALALLASFIEEIKIGLGRIGETIDGVGGAVSALNANILDVLHHYNVSIMNPEVMAGVFIGSMMAFLFCGLTMNAVGRAASKMVDEVRRQFREIKGILTREATPDYSRCVEISTKAAQKEMLLPSLIAIIVPMLVGVFLDVAGVLGLLVGGLASGFVLAIFMANSGGAWDNAKKYVEEGKGDLGGKGSPAHHATVVGDTVGDPFKDTSGPSLNILIKLMSMVSIVMAGVTVYF